MNIFNLEIWDDEGAKCTFYTVRKDGASDNETNKFFNKYYLVKELVNEIQQLMSFLIDVIGDKYGAIDELFNRYENEVVGLPNKGRVGIGDFSFLFPNFPLRLYALRIKNRNDIVVLFNGGLKTSRTNQTSKDLNTSWREACQFARRIDEAIRANEIHVDEENRKLISEDGSHKIIL